MLVVLLGRTFVFNVYVIPSRSMEDTLQIGEPRICLAIDSETLYTAPWRHHRVQKIPQTGWRGSSFPPI